MIFECPLKWWVVHGFPASCLGLLRYTTIYQSSNVLSPKKIIGTLLDIVSVARLEDWSNDWVLMKFEFATLPLASSRYLSICFICFFIGNFINQWVDLRENLQETMDFPMKYGIFLYFSLQPIH